MEIVPFSKIILTKEIITRLLLHCRNRMDPDGYGSKLLFCNPAKSFLTDTFVNFRFLQFFFIFVMVDLFNQSSYLPYPRSHVLNWSFWLKGLV